MNNRATPLSIIRQRFVGASEREIFSEATLSPTNCSDCQQLSESEVPAALTTLFAQRQAAQRAVFPSLPRPGLIVWISINEKVSEADASAEPLAVLLDHEISSDTWHGWLVGRDPGYACEWDLILGPEDEPRDPMCQVVQIWNMVTMKPGTPLRVLAELSSERLTAVRSLASDFAHSQFPMPIDDHRMGVHLARELTDGTGVVTGTSIKSSDDPRHEYQQLYRGASQQLSQQSLAPQVASKHFKAKTLTQSQSWIEAILGYPGRNWLLPLAFAAILLIVPTVIFLVLHQNPEHTGTGGSYVSGNAFQEIPAAHPDITSHELEKILRDAGALPEIRNEAGGAIIVEADLRLIPEEVQKQILATHQLFLPADFRLRVMIVPKPFSAPVRE